jgi:hypothetical protein
MTARVLQKPLDVAVQGGPRWPAPRSRIANHNVRGDAPEFQFPALLGFMRRGRCLDVAVMSQLRSASQITMAITLDTRDDALKITQD